MSGLDTSVPGIVKSLALTPHPEGGYFREIWRDGKFITGNRPGTLRNASTSILFLVPHNGRSRLHRLTSDETWNFNLGGAIAIYEMTANGPPIKTIIGPKGNPHSEISHTIKAGTWFGAIPEPGTVFSLVACSVIPGFDYSDFEIAERGAMLREYPQSAEIIDILT